MVRQTLYGKDSVPYSLYKLITTLHKQRKRRDGFDRLCARCVRQACVSHIVRSDGVRVFAETTTVHQSPLSTFS